MGNRPLVSIITPSYNQGQFIEETIKSVLSQTYENIQYIIVDGGSTDNTMDVVDKYKEQVDIIIHEKDDGQADAINKGFRLAKGKLVGWINSDDILHPNCVEKIVELYENNKDGVIYYCSKLNWIDAQSNFINQRKVVIPNRDFLLKQNYVLIQQGSFYDSQVLKRINYLNPKNHYCMDLDLWLRLLNHGNIYSLNDQSYSSFRVWEETKTSTGKEKFLKNIREVLLANGAPRYSKTVVLTYWYQLKVSIKQALKMY